MNLTVAAVLAAWRTAERAGNTVAAAYLRLIAGVEDPADTGTVVLDLARGLPRTFTDVAELIEVTGRLITLNGLPAVEEAPAPAPQLPDEDDEAPIGDTPALDVLALLSGAATAPQLPEEPQDPLARMTYAWDALAELLDDVDPSTITHADLTVAQLESVEDLLLTVGVWQPEDGTRPLTALAARWLDAEHPDRWRTDNMLTDDLRTFAQRVMLKAWTDTNGHPKLEAARQRRAPCGDPDHRHTGACHLYATPEEDPAP